MSTSFYRQMIEDIIMKSADQKYNPNHGGHGYFSSSDEAITVVHRDGTRELGPKHPDHPSNQKLAVPEASPLFQKQFNEMNEKAIENFAKDHNMTSDEYKHAVDEHLQGFMKDAKPFIRVQESSLQKILDSGRFKSQFETGSSGGILDSGIRSKVEEGLFSFPKDGDATQRPIYGYASANETGAPSGKFDRLANYGTVRVELNDDVKDRATMTIGDSLANASTGGKIKGSSLAGPMKNPTHKTIEFGADIGKRDPLNYHSLEEYRKKALTAYAETQYHGGVSTKDIKHVYFPSEPSKTTKNMLKEKNIPYSVG